MTTQTQTKHTAGPWVFKLDNGCYKIFPTKEMQEMSLATINDIFSEDLSNARLIASAPELLEALKEVMAQPVCHAVGCSHELETCSCHRSLALKAIAKAEGH